MGAVLRIPLIEDLTTGSVPAGSILMVEFDPASQWYAASMSIAAGWLRAGGKIMYNAYTQSPEGVRSLLTRLGLKAEELERNGKLELWDGYTCQLGQKSKEKFAHESLRVADLSILFSREQWRRSPDPEFLRISDNISSVARFNDEKALVEYLLTRGFPSFKSRKITTIRGAITGVHSDWFHKHVEAACDGIIDVKLDDKGEEPRNFMRIRAMRNVGFDGRWHQLKVDENFEVTLEK